MLVARDATLTKRAKHLAAQARTPAVHYEHEELGFNYRLSGLLAGVGRAQLRRLDDFVALRRALFERYRLALQGLPGLQLMPEASFGRSTRWLTCLTLAPTAKARPGRVIEALGAANIEARPVWKPLHLQPVFKGAECVGRQVSERLFEHGLCLPSGSGLTDVEQDRVIEIVRRELA
jgi:pyridoxal phosphate-dependent aminotransferase EpsN